MSISLAVLEDLVDGSGVAARIEVLLPVGVRHRQLAVRTLILGMLLTLDGRRPAFLTEAHAALTALPAEDQARLGVSADWKTGPHLLTYRQVEHTFHLVVTALGKDQPDGAPAGILIRICNDLLEASIPAWVTDATTALAADWTDVETWSRPRPWPAAPRPGRGRGRGDRCTGSSGGLARGRAGRAPRPPWWPPAGSTRRTSRLWARGGSSCGAPRMPRGRRTRWCRLCRQFPVMLFSLNLSAPGKTSEPRTSLQSIPATPGI